MYKEFLEVIKTGDLLRAKMLYQEYKSSNLENVEEEILIPKMHQDASIEEIADTPYGYALLHNYVDICDWLFKNFPNVKHNMDNVCEYDMIDSVCELGYLNALQWLHTNCLVLYNGDYHIDSFIIAVRNHHFEVADYLLKMFTTNRVLKDCMSNLMYKMLLNPDKEILFYLFTKLKENNMAFENFAIKSNI